MSNRILISGSVAFDSIMTCNEQFSSTFPPVGTKASGAQTLPAFNNLCLVANTLERQYGGCGANIAVNLCPFQSLGLEPIVLTAVGHDAQAYLDRLTRLGVNTHSIILCETMFTAQAFILTDRDNAQLTIFHPGAMLQAQQSTLTAASSATANTRLSLQSPISILSPNGRTAMLEHLQYFIRQGIPYLFDPGQALPLFDKAELMRFIPHAAGVVVNNTEAALLCQQTGLLPEQIAEQTPVFIVTHGSSGSTLYDKDKDGATEIRALPVAQAIDPTGCGDAYRAGLLAGLALGWPWLESAQLGSVLGAIKVQSRGAQNHITSLEEISQKLETAYGCTRLQPLPA